MNCAPSPRLLCGASIVTRTNRAPVAFPLGASRFRRWLFDGPKVAAPAGAKVTPSADVAIWSDPTEAESPSPQIAPGSTANDVMSTACGSCTVTCLEPGDWVFPGDVLAQPVACDWSNASAARHGAPNAGADALIRPAPPTVDAQSRRTATLIVA